MKSYLIVLALVAFIANIQIASAAPSSGLERIVNGDDAKKGQFPHQVSLRISNRHFCGGSIINERYVLTAAHCLTILRPEHRVTLVTGALHITNGGDRYAKERHIAHPNFSDKPIRNDIGLVRSRTDFKFNTLVKPIVISRKPARAGQSAVFSGWGDTVSGVRCASKIVRILFQLALMFYLYFRSPAQQRFCNMLLYAHSTILNVPEDTNKSIENTSAIKPYAHCILAQIVMLAHASAIQVAEIK